MYKLDFEQRQEAERVLEHEMSNDPDAVAFELVFLRDAPRWQPIETAPRNGKEIVVWCDGVQDLPPLVSRCAWHPDAGFCVDELREPKYWIAPPNNQGHRTSPRSGRSSG